MKKECLMAFATYILGWIFFLVIVTLGSSNESFNILKSSLFGIGDYILVAFYFTSITAISLTYLTEDKK